MKKRIIPFLCIACLTISSCMDKDVYDPEKAGKDNPDELDLSFKFALKSEKTVTVSATDANGRPAANVLFNIYLEKPYTQESTADEAGGEGLSHEIEPAYAGYTGKDGILRSSLVLPTSVEQIYVYPVTPGYGELKTLDVTGNLSAEFRSVPFPTSSGTRALAATRSVDLSQVSHKRIYNRYNIYSPFAATDANENGILIPGHSPLVSKEDLSVDFLNMVHSWYPERSFQTEEVLSQSSDLVITDDAGAELWVTYVSDGGFNIGNSSVYSSVLYYNYEPGDISSVADVYKGEQSGNSVNDTGLRMTMLFPNANSLQCAAGIKVQLLYWDKAKEAYSTVFPKGTRIGFVTGRSSYKALKAPIDQTSSYWFAQPVSANPKNAHYPSYELFYSTPCLNGKGLNQANAIIRACPDYDCILVGMDVRYWDDKQSDRDFNDVLLKVVANPPTGVIPEHNIEVDPVSPYDVQYGTLAFEDLWPSKGDYDFNDLVVDYAYKRIKSTEGIKELQLDFQPWARGGSKKSGFCIELPFPSGMVKSVSGATLEPGNDNATLIVWDDTDKAFSGRSGLVNTKANEAAVATSPATVKVTLSTPLTDAEVKFLKFNPFIYVEGKRGHEIHLVDYAPTSQADKSLFGTYDDRSDVNKKIYYRMDNTYPWALDIPRTSSIAPSWQYPLEGINITEVYLKYGKWIQDKSDFNWFDSSVPGNVDNSKLYKKK